MNTFNVQLDGYNSIMLDEFPEHGVFTVNIVPLNNSDAASASFIVGKLNGRDGESTRTLSVCGSDKSTLMLTWKNRSPCLRYHVIPTVPEQLVTYKVNVIG